ncbi:hypothetical protein UPYG_G00145250 [Umbra pygmaea]|uniref:Zinc-binding protein A33-like n=1 Tax=Umbra pygmaea TaxID=75934 RepID=A0ABD0WW54_UMBPY
MATSLSIVQEHLSCPICLDIFRNPVVLKCSHSFCEECLQKSWKDLEKLFCPMCKKECSSEEPSLSLALKSLCNSFQKGTENNQPENNCQLHGEKLKLFCFDDNQPICVVCHTSRKHKGHDCCPIEEAVPDLKSEIHSMLSMLKNKLENKNTAKMTHQSWAEYIKGQAQCAEKQIRTEFKKLHQFLEEEETARIAALREEVQQKEGDMRERAQALTRETTLLTETIEVINTEMDVDNTTFLQNYQATRNRAESMPPDTSDAENVSGVLVDMAKHVGSLKFKVWQKMLDFFGYIPVTMDPNTMSPKLTLTDDLCTVKYCEEKQNFPENPERFHYTGVLGSEGYSRGIHCWDVDVGDNDNWTIGVAKESIPRKMQVKMLPQNGLWVFRYVSGKYKAGTKPKVHIKDDERPQVIRVRLDCDKGELTFCDLIRNKTLYTFKDEFTEKVFPYFHTQNHICPLRLFGYQDPNNSI